MNNYYETIMKQVLKKDIIDELTESSKENKDIIEKVTNEYLENLEIDFNLDNLKKNPVIKLEFGWVVKNIMDLMMVPTSAYLIGYMKIRDVVTNITKKF